MSSDTDSASEDERLKAATVDCDTILGNAKQSTSIATDNGCEVESSENFKIFVAKKLRQCLDRELDYCELNVSSSAPGNKDGVKLLRNSTTFLKVEDDLKVKSLPKRRRLPHSECDDEDTEQLRLAEAAVTIDFVLKDSALHKVKGCKTKRLKTESIPDVEPD